MRLAVLSGKGGAGKTFVAVNLAVTAGRATYIDCDVEEPNGHLFLKPEAISEQPVTTRLPVFDPARCTGCRACVDFCRFNALLFLRGTPMVFPEVCHACGGCALVCPADAVSETERPLGHLELGRTGETTVITGVLDPGEASGMEVIRAALAAGSDPGLTVIDCPPGSACGVMECVSGADLCLLVAEPTAFGLHNFRMVHELVTLLGKPCGVVINKEERPYEPLDRYCREQELPILLRLPYNAAAAELAARGEIVCRQDEETAARFCTLLDALGGMG